MTDIIEATTLVLHVLFDLTANDGWNGVAMLTYASITTVIACAIIERKTKRKGI